MTKEENLGQANWDQNCWFSKVQNPLDWKEPIDSLCTSEEIKLIAEAIMFFTATKAAFDYLGIVEVDNGRFVKGDHIFKVRADGYRKGPAGDH